MNKLDNIKRLKERLNALRPLNGGELNRMLQQFAIRSTYNSNAIEGNTLTLRETALIIQEGITIAQKPIKDHLEAIGHKEAFDYIVALSQSDSLLSEHDIKSVHSLVLMNDRENAGVYRRIPVIISGASHTPPQPFDVPKLLAELVVNYNNDNDDNAFRKIANFHLRFESIHPFIDGNGRIGRLLMNLELMKLGYLPVDIKYTDRMKYYDAFDSFAATSSPNALADMIIDYETDELTEYVDAAEQINKTNELNDSENEI